MMRIARAFSAYFRAATAVMLQYRGEIVLWAVWGLVNPAVLYAMWSSAAESNVGGTVVGMTCGEIAAYYFVIMVVGHFTTAWDAYEMGYLIRTGQLSPALLRPILPIWQAIANNLAYKVTTLAFVVPMWVLFAWIVKPTFHTAVWQLAIGAVALLFASVLNFMLGYVVALIAFWAVKLDAVGEVYFGLGLFLGGRFAPIAALPHPINLVADALPFRWMYAFPTELLIGRSPTASAGASATIDLPEALAGLGIQLAWLIVTIIVFRILWAAAVKRYTAVSG